MSNATSMPDALPTAMPGRYAQPNAGRYARTDVRTYEELNYNSVDQLLLRTAHAHTAILVGFGCRAVLAPLAGGAA